MAERWIPVPFEGYGKVYEVSTAGIVRRIDNHKERRAYQHKSGYYRVLLSYQGKMKNITLHRLVALALLPNPDPERLTQVGHWDDNRANNRLENLYWTNAQENNCHGDRLKKHIETLEDKRKRASNRRKGKKIPVFMLVPTSTTGVTAIWYCSIAQASRECGVPAVDIRAACYGIRESAGGYRWVLAYSEEELHILKN